jgi:hypothetical protein
MPWLNDAGTVAFLAGLTVGVAASTASAWLLQRRTRHGRRTHHRPDQSHMDANAKSNYKSADNSPNSRYNETPTAHSATAALEIEFKLASSQLLQLVKHFVSELSKGLQSTGQTIKALPSFVTRRPTGRETGTYLALDLGGTNLRVCEVVLLGGEQGKFRMRQKKYTVSDEASLLSDTKLICRNDIYIIYVSVMIFVSDMLGLLFMFYIGIYCDFSYSCLR